VFVGNTGTRADRAGETVDAIEKEIRRIAEEGPTQKELDDQILPEGVADAGARHFSKLAQALLHVSARQAAESTTSRSATRSSMP